MIVSWCAARPGCDADPEEADITSAYAEAQGTEGRGVSAATGSIPDHRGRQPVVGNSFTEIITMAHHLDASRIDTCLTPGFRC